ncbi:MAG: DUF3108 domain-containing protein [Thiobacillus sp.]|nr:DUF3108 domain-containing protein [Thiobacillus sp.]
MRRSLRPWWLALGVSLLLHLALIGGPGWRLPQWESPPEPPPIEARLLPQPEPFVPPPRPQRAPPVAKKPPAPRLPPAEPSPTPEPVVELVDDREVPVVAERAAPVAMPVEAAPMLPPAPVAPSAPPLNPLPSRLELRFQVRYGIAGGEQVLLWVNEGERYTLTSVAEATGLAGMFYRGKLVQISRGRITPHGLQPEEFWDQRGDKRSSGRFDADSHMLTLEPHRGPPRHFSYTGEVQDVLSLFFQFALTAPPPDKRQTYTVFNGKKLRDYTYEIRGEEALETALGKVNTLHLARLTEGDGRFEVWLAIDRHYLPVRILRSEESKADVELVIVSIAGD